MPAPTRRRHPIPQPPKPLLVFLLAAAGALPSTGRAALADPDRIFAEANRAFEQGDYPGAEAAYRSLVAEPLVSAELFFNLGNALYRQDRAGEAALWYRRALEIDPRFAEARQNLRVVKKKTGYHEFELTGPEAALARLGRGELIAVLSAGAWIALLALAAALLARRLQGARPLLFAAVSIGALLATAAGWGLRRQQAALSADTLAVVTAPDAAARTSPAPDAETVVALPPGSELRILQEAGPWTYVAIPRDLRGWVRSDSLGRVRWFEGPPAG